MWHFIYNSNINAFQNIDYFYEWLDKGKDNSKVQTTSGKLAQPGW